MTLTLTPEKIRALSDFLTRGIVTLQVFIELGESMKLLISERDRTERSFKAGKRPLDWQDFIKALYDDGSPELNGIAELLGLCEMKKFDVGRLWFETPQNCYFYISLHRDKLKDKLYDMYGVKFQVRIICEGK